MPKKPTYDFPPTYSETKEREKKRVWTLMGKTPASVLAGRKTVTRTENIKSSVLKGLDALKSKSARDDKVVELWEKGKITSKEMFKRLEGK